MRWLLALALLLLLTSRSQAHDLKLTGLKVIWDKDKLTFSVITPASRLGPGDPDTNLRHRLKLRLNGKSFVPRKTTLMRDPANDIVMWQAQYQGAVATLDVLARLYPEDATSRLVVTVFKDGRIFRESLLNAGHPAVQITASGASNTVADSKPGTVIRHFMPTATRPIYLRAYAILYGLGLPLLGGALRLLLKIVAVRVPRRRLS